MWSTPTPTQEDPKIPLFSSSLRSNDKPRRESCASVWVKVEFLNNPQGLRPTRTWTGLQSQCSLLWTWQRSLSGLKHIYKLVSISFSTHKMALPCTAQSVGTFNDTATQARWSSTHLSCCYGHQTHWGNWSRNSNGPTVCVCSTGDTRMPVLGNRHRSHG